MEYKTYKILGYLQLFTGMSAITGGIPMLLTPDGSNSGLSPELLQNTPFDNFLLPGVLLFSVNGLGNLAASYFSLKFKEPAGMLGILFGLAMIIWISAQIYFLGFTSILQGVYLLIGGLEIFLGIRIQRKL